MKKFLILFILLFSANAFAVAYTSNGGLWSTPASWTPNGVPGSGDTVVIQAGHKITIDGNITIGMAPASTTTYDLDISGQLHWPNTPSANWVFTARSSVRVNSGGEIAIPGTGASLDCARTAEWVFENSTANKKYTMFLNSGKLKIYGCENYTNSSGTVTRARIASCSPDCAIGAGKTITLDRDVNWSASTGWVGDNIFFGSGGSIINLPAATDDTEYITSWGIGSSTTITGVTFTENHQIGDLVENGSRNVVFRSDSTTYHSKVYSTAAVDDVYDINWVLFDEFGDYNSANNMAINYGNSSHSFGTIDYVVVRNCEDGNTSGGFYLSYAGTVCPISNCLVYDVGYNGYGYILRSETYTTGTELLNLSYYGRGTSHTDASKGNGIKVELSTSYKLLEFWGARVYNGITGANYTYISDSIIHSVRNGAILEYSSININNITLHLINNEFRTSNRMLVDLTKTTTLYMRDNTFYNAGYSCVKLGNSTVYAYNNTYDKCNMSSSPSYSALTLWGYGDYMGYNEHFGQLSPNTDCNIMWYNRSWFDNVGFFTKFECTDCLFADPDTPSSSGRMPIDGIYIYDSSTTPTYTTGTSQNTYLTFHNKDQVLHSHSGWGPGGVYFTKESTIVQDGSVALHLYVGCPLEYSWFEVGKTYVNSGDALSVSIDLRKDEAQPTTGHRPRLGLIGCGFDREIHYDEMSDVTDTWETVTVSGTTECKGVVHIYVGTHNELSGVNGYAPIWPPTLEVYADKIVVTK